MPSVTKCDLCKRGIYQVIQIYTNKPKEALSVYVDELDKIIFDRYCIACRGLFNLYVNTRKINEKEIVQYIKNTYAPIEFKRKKVYGLETGGIVAIQLSS